MGCSILLYQSFFQNYWLYNFCSTHLCAWNVRIITYGIYLYILGKQRCEKWWQKSSPQQEDGKVWSSARLSQSWTECYFLYSHQTTKFGFCAYGQGCLLGISDTVSCGKSDNRPHFCMSLLNSILKYSYLKISLKNKLPCYKCCTLKLIPILHIFWNYSV